MAKDGVAFLETEDQIRHGRRVPGAPVVYELGRTDGQQLELRRTTMPDAGFVLTVTDMTKRAQAEGVLREAQKMQAIGHLTGGIAHDFNNLLTVILGNLEFVRSRLTGEQALQSRIERATWAAQRGATLTSQLQSAILNLALNARDAMPDGGRLTIELANKVLDEEYARDHAEVTPGDYAMLAVSDTGHGMTPDVVARIFEPFFTTKPQGKGTGLGLAMVFGFVKQSGGHVKVYSEPGEGTTVRLYLPRAVGAEVPAGQRTGTPVQLPRGSGTVLVVEDEPAVREIAIAILSDLGYHVFEAADGEDALRVFVGHASSIDLLLTDVVHPGK